MADPVALTRRVFFTRVYTIRVRDFLSPNQSKSYSYELVYAPLFIHIRRSRYSAAWGRAWLTCRGAKLFPVLPPNVPTPDANSLWMFMSAGCVDGIRIESGDGYAVFDIEVDVYVANDMVNVVEAGLGSFIMRSRWVVIDEVDVTPCKDVSGLTMPNVLWSMNMPIEKGFPIAVQVCNKHRESIAVALHTAEQACGTSMPYMRYVPPGTCMVFYAPPQVAPLAWTALQWARNVVLIGAKNARRDEVIARVSFMALEVTA